VPNFKNLPLYSHRKKKTWPAKPEAAKRGEVPICTFGKAQKKRSGVERGRKYRLLLLSRTGAVGRQRMKLF
jgi:hypothetical protein